MKRMGIIGINEDSGSTMAEVLTAGLLLLMLTAVFSRCVMVSGRMAQKGKELRGEACRIAGNGTKRDAQIRNVTVLIDGEPFEWKVELEQYSDHMFGIGGILDEMSAEQD